MTLQLFATGRLADLAPDARSSLIERTPSGAEDLTATVRAIIADVQQRGDAALFEMSSRFDGATLSALEVPQADWNEALEALDADARDALTRAARNIHAFHAAQLPADVCLETEPGVRITRAWTPLPRVGVYAPGGRAAYPSSVLMGVVAAKAAGVGEVVVCSPPGPDGVPPMDVLAACAISGADRLFSIGGAGAIAALVYGTTSVPSVDAVVGPGNQWVTEAKRQLAGRVLIDSPAGPSEVLVVADGSADPEWVAGEMLAQAEHDPEAACVTITDDARIAEAIIKALGKQLASAPRASIAHTALATAGAVLIAATLEQAFDFAQEYAPEHLSIMTADAADWARRVTTAGTTFVGGAASVAFGDYMTGANHVLPTAGRARSFSGLSAQHFLRSFTIQEITPAGAAAMADDVALLATREGLPAHADAARFRSRP